jgi:hypothetical protein
MQPRSHVTAVRSEGVRGSHLEQGAVVPIGCRNDLSVKGPLSVWKACRMRATPITFASYSPAVRTATSKSLKASNTAVSCFPRINVGHADWTIRGCRSLGARRAALRKTSKSTGSCNFSDARVKKTQSPLVSSGVGARRPLFSFRATLEEVKRAEILLHVQDASSPIREEQKIQVEKVLAELAVSTKLVIRS